MDARYVAAHFTKPYSVSAEVATFCFVFSICLFVVVVYLDWSGGGFSYLSSEIDTKEPENMYFCRAECLLLPLL